MIDRTHLNSLYLRLSHEQAYLGRAKRSDERRLRKVWVQQLEREIEAELRFLGLEGEAPDERSDDELLAELLCKRGPLHDYKDYHASR